MTSRGELMVLRNGDAVVVVDSDQIAASMQGKLPLGLVVPTIDGTKAVVLSQYTIQTGTHIVFALQEEGLLGKPGGELFFASYMLVAGVWEQTDRIIKDPLGNIKQDVMRGGYDIRTIHVHYLRCCV